MYFSFCYHVLILRQKNFHGFKDNVKLDIRYQPLSISDFVSALYIFFCMKMSSFEPNKRHLRELLIYFFNLKKSAAEVHRLLVEAYSDATLSERSCRE